MAPIGLLLNTYYIQENTYILLLSVLIVSIIGSLPLLASSENEKQVSMINDDHHFSTVLQYYAAITKLHIPGIKDNLTAVAKKCGGVQNHRLQPKILTSNSCVDLMCDKKEKTDAETI